VSERAIPAAIFAAEPHVKVKYLRKWCKDNSIGPDVNFRDIVDWEYYKSVPSPFF
jgi:DNA polymerase epsilon subunit 1